MLGKALNLLLLPRVLSVNINLHVVVVLISF